MKIETLLSNEIESEFGELGKIAVGSEDYKAAVDGVTKLVDRAIKLKETEIAAQEKEKELEQKDRELELKEEQLKEDKKDHLIKNILTGLGIAVPSGITIWGTIKSIKFEQEGTITTIIGRGFINKLLPKK